MTTSPCPWCDQPIEFLALDNEWIPCPHCGHDCVILVDFAFDESIGQRRRTVTLEKLTGIGPAANTAETS